MRAQRLHRRLAALCVLSALLGGLAAVPAQASPMQQSMFQDDALLAYPPPAQVARTLDSLRYLGVDVIRVSVLWSLVAPNPNAATRPSFDAADPAAYPALNWARYDTVVRLARERGIDVNLNVDPPVPAWAGGGTGNTNYVGHYRPSAREYGLFMHALGTRYSGSYMAGGRTLPRVSFWSIWNEPNGVHFLSPPWAVRGKRNFEASAAIYRSLVDAGSGALWATGHGPATDTVLIGETAPKGQPGPGQNHSLRPLRFVRALYCLNRALRPLGGHAARALGCPARDQARAFPAAHPALFAASGWAHHPYQLLLAPTVPSETDSVSTADLPRLTGTLDWAFATYGQSRRLPLYLTEYGYESNPPNPFGVSLARQAAFINQAEFMAYRNPRVLSYDQFLLVDSAGAGFFKTGLKRSGGRSKPAFGAYRVPIHLPRTVSSSGRFRVWGLLRPGRRAGVRVAAVQFRASGSSAYATIATATAGGSRGYVDRTVHVAASGSIRLAFHDPASGRTTFSRSVAVYVG